MKVGSNTKVFEKPKPGLYRGVLADIVDLGLISNTYQGKTEMVPTVRLVWILDAKDAEGGYFRVMRQVRASMGENANLFGIVKDMTGKTPVVVAGEDYDLDPLLGHNNELVIALETSKKGKEFANIKAIMQPLTKVNFAVPSDFVRSKDRKKEDKNAQAAAQAANQKQAEVSAPAPEDEDISF